LVGLYLETAPDDLKTILIAHSLIEMGN